MNTTEKLVALLRKRHSAGLAKYGVTLDRTDLTFEQWCDHAIEEALDFAGYLMRIKNEQIRNAQETGAENSAGKVGSNGA